MSLVSKLTPCQGVIDLFGDGVEETLWAEDLPAGSSRNGHGNAIARAVFSVCKTVNRIASQAA